MDLDLAITRNREALLRIVAALFAMAGLGDDEIAATLPRHLRRAVLFVLRSAESAARRLIVIAARGIVLEPRKKAPAIHDAKAARPPVTHYIPVSLGLARFAMPAAARLEPEPKPGAEPPLPAFALFDPPKRFGFQRRQATTQPRLHSLSGGSEPASPCAPAPPERSPDDAVGAARLCRRMIALQRALDDLPGQAMRLARWRAARFSGPHRTGRVSPMRPGWPPGRRKRPVHEVDYILNECHNLALRAPVRADTS